MQNDPIELAIFKSILHSIAVEMGVALRRTAFSPNIKERRDYSSAVFDADGRVIAMGDDMPVHLGSMPMSVRAALDQLTLERGDIAILNDPYAGGTHLPDITLVMPVFANERSDAAFFVANRAHHADVGGMYPGSMGPCREIYQEGIRIPPTKIIVAGEWNRDLLSVILNNVRTPREREGDLAAQIGACRTGEARLLEAIDKYGLARIETNAAALLDYSERLMAAELEALPPGRFTAEDYLDDDGVSGEPVRIAVAIETQPAHGHITIDFNDSAKQAAGSVNAVAAITHSAVYYVLRCLLPGDTPATAGLVRRVRVRMPEESVVNASPPAAVAGGNVETSQRIVDVLLKAFAQMLPERIPAASSGSMSNLTVGGIDSRTGQPFAYYETIAGGSGARPHSNGVSGVHTHMTNSLNTPVEALEYAYPLRVRRYSFRQASGGEGQYRGGNGLLREIEFLDPVQVTLLSDRRKTEPYGLQGGANGRTGCNSLIENQQPAQLLPGKCSRYVKPGSILRIETPGGGGFGKADPASA